MKQSQPQRASKRRSQPPLKGGQVHTERQFPRFNLSQRWEHGLLIITFTGLLLTGLPQKYFSEWGYRILTTPDSILRVRQVHHIFAVMLTLEVIYHLVKNLYLMARRRLPADIFPTWQDVRDAWGMLKYLLFLKREKPVYGKYNFEQKFTYWFMFLAIGILVVSGFILWFPLIVTRVLPGGIIPAAMLAHSNEAIAAAIFVVIWHFYHVHFERLNLSIFTGWLNERDMRRFHAQEFERQTGERVTPQERRRLEDGNEGERAG